MESFIFQSIEGDYQLNKLNMSYVFVTGAPSPKMKYQLIKHMQNKTFRQTSTLSCSPTLIEPLKDKPKKDLDLQIVRETPPEELQRRAEKELEILRQKKRLIFTKITERAKRKAREKAEKLALTASLLIP